MLDRYLFESLLFESLTQVREITDSWIDEYNYEQAHESLNELPAKIYEQRSKENSSEI
ncbi:integrase core domain-containing protein [Thalassotalea aquiviva]|uniref:integrase core domain-containing protein n=1 Tax=Thalassotalea aquiviva TaxID=3242415 RepID=UPI003529E666